MWLFACAKMRETHFYENNSGQSRTSPWWLRFKHHLDLLKWNFRSTALYVFEAWTIFCIIAYNDTCHEALTKYKWPKMKRDARQNAVIFSRLYFVRALWHVSLYAMKQKKTYDLPSTCKSNCCEWRKGP